MSKLTQVTCLSAADWIKLRSLARAQGSGAVRWSAVEQAIIDKDKVRAQWENKVRKVVTYRNESLTVFAYCGLILVVATHLLTIGLN